MGYLTVDKEQALRFLGYQQQVLDTKTASLINECAIETQELVQPRTLFRQFEIIRASGQLYLEQSALELIGDDIVAHLKGAHSCILLAITLGNAIDTRIRYYEKINMTKALVLDACASAIVEQVADDLCRQKEKILKAQAKQLTTRFSPGYGDFPIESQLEFIATLNADKLIGLTASSYSVLLPRKSITAIVGVVDKTQKTKERNCMKCNKLSDCQFRKEK